MKLRNWSEALSRAVVDIAKTLPRVEEYFGDGQKVPSELSEGALLYQDMGGCLVLTADGHLLCWTWESGGVSPLEDEAFRVVALRRAASLCPLFGAYVPVKSKTSRGCAMCGGSGAVYEIPCGQCGGLGWW